MPAMKPKPPIEATVYLTVPDVYDLTCTWPMMRILHPLHIVGNVQ